MNELNSPEKQKKLLESPFVGNLIVPIAIVLVGAFVVWGATRLLSTERSHRDLIREMRSKTFGNRWIAAYELSKLIASSSLPDEDIPWVIESLSSIALEAKEPRTRKFVVSALGAMKNPLVLPILEKTLGDSHPEVQFHSVVAISRIPPPISFHWELLEAFLESSDRGLVQVTLLTLATHRVGFAQEKLVGFLAHDDHFLRFSAAIGLINYRDTRSIPVLREILFLETLSPSSDLGLDSQMREKLKLNLLTLLTQNRWTALHSAIHEALERESSLKVVSQMRETLGGFPGK